MQIMMQITGLSRKEVEEIASKEIKDMGLESFFQQQSPNAKSSNAKSSNAKSSKNTSKPNYDEENYPHYLPAKKVQKYTIRVSLRGISPVIWRKFECPSNITLRHLTEYILSVMDWMGYHLNHIAVGDVFYEPYYQRDAGMEDMGWTEHRNQEDYTIADILNEKGKTVRFEYDFGDSWEHDIRLSAIDEYKKGEPREIVFKSGKRACPPEDCGGIWGYQNLLKIYEKKVSGKRLTKEERGHLEWYQMMDDDFDPDYFDIDETKSFTEDFNVE